MKSIVQMPHVDDHRHGLGPRPELPTIAHLHHPKAYGPKVRLGAKKHVLVDGGHVPLVPTNGTRSRAIASSLNRWICLDPGPAVTRDAREVCIKDGFRHPLQRPPTGPFPTPTVVIRQHVQRYAQ